MLQAAKQTKQFPPGQPKQTRNRAGAFTLAELLISLAILAEIATFTIPKVLSAQQNGQKTAIVKETAAMLSAAYSQYQLNGTISSNTNGQALTPYMNYVKVDTTSNLDPRPGGSARDCNDGGSVCLRLHNGALLWIPITRFGGTGALNAFFVHLDPDRTNTGTADSVTLMLYYNGRVTSRANVAAGTADGGGGTYTPGSYDPSWFSW
jgi:type II secretory pathway pseudopilin PulG